MSVSAPYVVLVAKQREIEELQRLRSRSHLVGVLGHLIHVLQAERGASSLFLASAGTRFETVRQQQASESEAVEGLLRQAIEDELKHASFANAKILSLIAWVLLGLDALPELRRRIAAHQLSGHEAVAAFSRLIAGLIALVFEVADTAVAPDVSRLLVALFNLIEGKELAGQERAIGALAFGSGSCATVLQQRILHLADAQERNFRLFLDFAEESVAARWQEMETLNCVTRLDELRREIRYLEQDAHLDTDHSDEWFHCCSERITFIWGLQRSLVERLQQRCAELIAMAEQELFDSQGLLRSMRENSPARAEAIDRFFDPTLPVERSLSFGKAEGESAGPKHSLIDLLQAQSQHLAQVENELASARTVLNDRKLIERAKGLLMARHQIDEDAAYKRIRKESMDRNLRLVEVAEAILSQDRLT